MDKKEKTEKKNAVKIFAEELSKSSFVFILLAIFTGLVIGGILAAATTVEVYEAFDRSIGEGFSESLNLIWETYSSLFTGSFGKPVNMVTSLFSGDKDLIRDAYRPFLESLVTSTPYIFTGVAIALGFQAGVFNIGAEGQLLWAPSCPPGRDLPSKGSPHNPCTSSARGRFPSWRPVGLYPRLAEGKDRRA